MAKELTADMARPGEVPLNITWAPAEGLLPLFSDQMHLAKVSGQFYLTFGQVRVPVTLPEPNSAVEIRPVMQVVIPKRALVSLINLLRQGLEQWGEE